MTKNALFEFRMIRFLDNVVMPKEAALGPQGASSLHFSAPRRASHVHCPGLRTVYASDVIHPENRPRGKRCMGLGKGFPGHLVMNSGHLHHGLGGAGTNSKDMSHWLQGCLEGKWSEVKVADSLPAEPQGKPQGCLIFRQRAWLKLVQSGMFLHGRIAWDFSKSWLLSLRIIEIMRNHQAKCQISSFTSQAGLFEPIPFTSLESLPSKYSGFSVHPSYPSLEDIMWKIHPLKYGTFPKGPYKFCFKRSCNLNQRNKFANGGLSNSSNVFGDRNFLDVNLCLPPRAAIMHYHKLGSFQQQKLIFLQLWRPEVWNQRVSRTMLPLKTTGMVPSLWSSLLWTRSSMWGRR